MNTIQYSLFENQMQSIMTDIVCLALENRQHLIANQVKTSLDDFKMNDQIIIESESKKDNFNRAKFEMYFDKTGAYNEASFNLIQPEFCEKNLVNILQLHKLDIAKNIFKYSKI